jgi:hypothetical protein
MPGALLIKSSGGGWVVIDFHAHCRVGQGTLDDLVRVMDASEVDVAVLHPIEPAMEGIGSADTAWVA